MKKSLQTASLALLLLCIGGATAARADVKIKTRNTAAGQTSEGTTYIKGKRQRTEQNETAVTITQCDLRRNVQLGVPTKTYFVMPFDQKTDAATSSAANSSPAAGSTAVRRGGIITSTFTSTDTGERKKIFGYTARRIKTSIQTESSPDACQVSRTRMETDGWYIDAQFALDCDYGMAANSYVPPTPPGGCRDEYRTKQIGVAKLGYPVSVTTTLFDDKGQASYTFTQEVVEITNAVLDSALFEVPADYRQVNDMREMYSAAAMTAAAGNANDADDAGGNAATSGGAARLNASVGAKREGVMRVGVPKTETGLTGDNVDAAALAQAVRGALMSNLNNPTIEVVALEASGQAAVESEARQKECDFVLYSTVAHKKGGGGGFGGFLKKSAAIASGAVSPTGGGQGGAASSLKAKDELTLEYRLQRGAEGVVANTIKAKAKSDGEDLISQLTGQAAVAVRAAVATKK
ncbi:MAG TPA: hypothetical protein VGO96_14690 [Pyrinomonadaceae bacterium]|jgi:hypothetical protein|nr:hypothetical protein [Pyrinomonadaceae bacterium]